ncbi:MAG: L28 family ribosomal protein [Candidatus Omnitrophica bacterium]|nr:L28 family ribosomal protein [Candidatus Omnitrophota bacterium]MDD5574850.1 L28 family ribosomal protein [Candidatus Omnitrophota bacterium]
MSKVCIVCEKHKVIGGHTARRGMARIKGGAGRKITGRSRRTFKPNVHRVKIVDTRGRITTAYVCAKCLKAGKVKKAR